MTLWNDTTKLWVAGFIQQLFGTSERTAYAWVGLRDRWRHIQAERRTMTRELWLQVCRQFDWTCLRWWRSQLSQSGMGQAEDRSRSRRQSLPLGVVSTVKLTDAVCQL
jgi:hypothetical protein